ncbi:MAG TPA: HD domain-containing protein [Candidatus Xenobia bacterium]
MGENEDMVRERVFRDPVHGNIRIEDPAILAVIDAPEFQRLRRIRQLGMCFNTYHGAEHSRFQHSIGAMWIMHRILASWADRGYLEVTREKRRAACLAALLHDLGHGPFSHALEHTFSHYRHEDLGRDLLVRRLAPMLEALDVDVTTVVGLIMGTTQDTFLHELISSQLDVDRMDYLMRDSLYAGVKYGMFDLERVIATLLPLHDGDRVVTAIDPKGVHAVEEYIFCRYFMYWQVYFHKTTRASEVLLRLVLRRARELAPHIYLPPNLAFLFNAQSDWIDAFVDIDDYDIFHCIKLWQREKDEVLSGLAEHFTHRRLFKMIPCPDAEGVDRVRGLMDKRYGEMAGYYWHLDRPHDSAYDFYRSGHGKDVIRVKSNGGWAEISEAAMTGAIRALAQEVSKTWLCVAPECHADVLAVLGMDCPMGAVTV